MRLASLNIFLYGTASLIFALPNPMDGVQTGKVPVPSASSTFQAASLERTIDNPSGLSRNLTRELHNLQSPEWLENEFYSRGSLAIISNGLLRLSSQSRCAYKPIDLTLSTCMLTMLILCCIQQARRNRWCDILGC